MTIVNLLPFEVAIFTSERMDSFEIYPACDKPAEFISEEYCIGYINQFPVKKDTVKKVINLPDEVKDTVYLVPKNIALFCSDRKDLCVPSGSAINKNKRVCYTYLKKY